MKKTAVIFPGVGYTKDRPLLYYAGKLAAACGYKLIHIDFSGIDWSKEKLKDHDFLMHALDVCLDRTEKVIGDLETLQNNDTVFISKSIGTVAASAYARKKNLSVKQICFSPLEMMGEFITDRGAVLYYGDDDPFADCRAIERIAKEKELKTYRISGGNHSLETGDIFRDIENLKSIMKSVSEVLTGRKE